MKTSFAWLALAVVLIAALAGCSGSAPSPTPAAPTAAVASTAAPTLAPTEPPATPAPAATATPATATATPAASPTEATSGAEVLPAGWEQHSNEQLSIAVPPGWRVVTLSGEDAASVFENMKQNDARLADIIGGPEALTGAALWAFGPEEGEFVDNLNIRRSPLGGQRITDMQQVVDVLLPEYDKMGLKVTSTDASLRVGDLPAARVTYTLMVNTVEGKAQEIRGRQILVATDSDLWVLSYSTTPERETTVAPDFERSAQTFEPK